MHLPLTRIRQLFDRIREWVKPTPKPEPEPYMYREQSGEAILFHASIEAFKIITDLRSKGYSPPEIFLVLGRVYGEVAGSSRSFTFEDEGEKVTIEDLENTFFELCSRERKYKEFLEDRKSHAKGLN